MTLEETIEELSRDDPELQVAMEKVAEFGKLLSTRPDYVPPKLVKECMRATAYMHSAGAIDDESLAWGKKYYRRFLRDPSRYKRWRTIRDIFEFLTSKPANGAELVVLLWVLGMMVFAAVIFVAPKEERVPDRRALKLNYQFQT